MQWAEWVYGRAPEWLQNIGLSLHGWQIRRHRYGKPYERAVKDLLQSQWWPQARLQEYRNEQLKRIVAHAYERCGFYRDRFDQVGVKPSDISTVADLPKLPILTKDDVRSQAAQLLSHNPRRSWLEGHTSGTTGSPLSIWYDRPTCILNNAVDRRYKIWAGMRSDDWIGLFLGRVIVPLDQTEGSFWRVNRALHQVWFSSFHLSDEYLPAIVAEIRRRRLAFLEGYPSTLFVVANYLLRSEQTLPMKAVISSSETLHSAQREAIEEAFCCQLFDYFAMAERVVYAGECEQHVGKHIAEEYGILEIVDEDGDPVQSGEPGFVVGTSLHNSAMPMIRYKMSDVSAIIADACPCGRGLTRMADVTTKAEDIVITPDGRWISPSVLTHPFKPLRHVLKSQIVQDELDHLAVKIVPDGAFSEEEERSLKKSLRTRLGGAVRVDIEIVEDIPREPSGKFRWVVSEIPHSLKINWT